MIFASIGRQWYVPQTQHAVSRARMTDPEMKIRQPGIKFFKHGELGFQGHPAMVCQVEYRRRCDAPSDKSRLPTETGNHGLKIAGDKTWIYKCPWKTGHGTESGSEKPGSGFSHPKENIPCRSLLWHRSENTVPEAVSPELP
jgi:hypothetical protein